jgi:hypothetical protein
VINGKRETEREAEIRAALKDAISAGVQVELEKIRVSPSNGLAVVVDKKPQTRGLCGLSTAAAFSYGAFRKKMVREGRWQRAYEILSRERFAQLFNAQMKAQELRRPDPAQQEFDFSIFENLPRRMHVEWGSVKEYRVRFARYEKRINRNVLALADMSRIADMIRDQPDELPLPEALARAEGAGTRKAAK